MEPESKPSAIAEADRAPVQSGGPSKVNYNLKQFASIEILRLKSSKHHRSLSFSPKAPKSICRSCMAMIFTFL